jgi:hypothetical protein
VSLSRALSAVCVVLALVVAGGCGGDGGGENSSAKTPDEWATAVCGALGDWGESLQAGTQALGPALGNTKNLENVKERFVGFLEDAEQASGTLVDEVESAGPPETDEGEAIQRQFVAALEEVQMSFARAVDRANELSTTGVGSFRDGVGAISTEVELNLRKAGASFNSLEDKSSELEEAIDGNARCNQFTNAG